MRARSRAFQPLPPCAGRLHFGHAPPGCKSEALAPADNGRSGCVVDTCELWLRRVSALALASQRTDDVRRRRRGLRYPLLRRGRSLAACRRKSRCDRRSLGRVGSCRQPSHPRVHCARAKLHHLRDLSRNQYNTASGACFHQRKLSPLAPRLSLPRLAGHFLHHRPPQASPRVSHRARRLSARLGGCRAPGGLASSRAALNLVQPGAHETGAAGRRG